MNSKLEAFDFFADDFITSGVNQLNGELDLLVMQYIFQSEVFDELNIIDRPYNNDIAA